MDRRRSILRIGLTLAFILLSVGCAAPKTLPSGPGAEWNLVVIGDSSMWELGEAFARQIEKDKGVKVVLDDYALPTLSAGSVREVLETGKSVNSRLEKLPDAIKEAEVVVMFVNPVGSIDPAKPLDLEGCFGSYQPNACEMERFAKYTDDLKVIWAKVIELRDGQPTILRATDIYNPIVADWKRNNAFEACNECWGNMSAAARQAAEAYNVPFLSRYDAFNGTVHSEDPNEKGYIDSDGEHPTKLAGEFTAGLLSTMGYEPVVPPE